VSLTHSETGRGYSSRECIVDIYTCLKLKKISLRCAVNCLSLLNLKEKMWQGLVRSELTRLLCLLAASIRVREEPIVSNYCRCCTCEPEYLISLFVALVKPSRLDVFPLLLLTYQLLSCSPRAGAMVTCVKGPAVRSTSWRGVGRSLLAGRPTWGSRRKQRAYTRAAIGLAGRSDLETRSRSETEPYRTLASS
jgi:hypothetical protein